MKACEVCDTSDYYLRKVWTRGGAKICTKCRERLLKRAKYHCELCGTQLYDNKYHGYGGYVYDLHHMWGKKPAQNYNDLTVVCHSCHSLLEAEKKEEKIVEMAVPIFVRGHSEPSHNSGFNSLVKRARYSLYLLLRMRFALMGTTSKTLHSYIESNFIANSKTRQLSLSEVTR